MDIKLSEGHDIQVVDGDFILTESESESLTQRLTIKLLTFQGEWYLNNSEGIPYYQSILGKNRAKETIDNIFKDAIIEEPEVVSLVSFRSSIDNARRVYKLNFTVESTNQEELVVIDIEI